MATKYERDFQKKLVKKLKETYPGCIVAKLDANQHQGIPDLLILNGNKWATLECKISKTAKRRPNQGYWVDKMNKMSFSRFIYPENEEEVLRELERTFKN